MYDKYKSHNIHTYMQYTCEVFLCTYKSVCMCTYEYVYIFMYVLYVCMYMLRVYVCMYICMSRVNETMEGNVCVDLTFSEMMLYFSF